MSSTPTTGFTPSAAANKKKAGYNNGLKKRGGHSTKQDPSKVDTSGERVIDPRQVDVLCGRGGMSNHHPGNEWYRRLIRSNRPLYRACPKHTKLLVAKAIVQAVGQQEGRFLERDLKTGFWYPVPYKRAVDKTSQGLRERDREDNPNHPHCSSSSSSGHNNNNDDEEEPVDVPDSFSGKSKAPPNLRALAQVAIDSANRDAESYGRSSSSSAVNKRPPAIGTNHNSSTAVPPPPVKRARSKVEPPAALQKSTTADGEAAADSAAHPNNRRRKAPPPAAVPSPATTTIMERGVSGHFGTSQAAAASMFSQPQIASAANNALLGGDDMAPLPPMMQVRESSMYRLLKHTQLLPGTSSSVGALEPRPLLQWPSNATNSNGVSSSSSSQAYNNLPSLNPTNYLFPPQGMYYNTMQQQNTLMQRNTLMQQQPPLFSGSSASTMPSMFSGFSQELQQQQHTQQFQQQQHFQVPQQQTLQPHLQSLQHPEPQQQQQQQLDRSAPSLTRFTSQVSDWLNSFWPTDNAMGRQASVHQVRHNVAKPGNDNYSPPQEGDLASSLPTLAMVATAAVAPSKASTTTASRKRKSQVSLPRLPYGVTGGEDGNTNSSDGGLLYQPPSFESMPTELEQSVSATLLTLASSPSKLFSGLTSFFVEKGVLEVEDQRGGRPEEGEMMPPTPGSAKKSQNSLLDDYEESPMEARLRTVQYA